MNSDSSRDHSTGESDSEDAEATTLHSDPGPAEAAPSRLSDARSRPDARRSGSEEGDATRLAEQGSRTSRGSASVGVIEGQTAAGVDTGIDVVASPAGASQSGSTRSNAQTPPSEDLARLREAINAKVLQQNRPRPSHGSALGSYTNIKRVSPIKEEGISPTSTITDRPTETAPMPFAAVRTTSTVSTESTESQRTLRGFTPLGEQPPLRTPSYPFPYVPGTPRSWSTSFHQPFTTLSPTLGAPRDEHDVVANTSSGVVSSVNTPIATASFAPPGESRDGPEDPRFPTPNLYNMTLQLNSEPGLEEWWATVTNLLHDHFKADRAILIMPTDSTDIENTSWGQKATFSMNGREEWVSHPAGETQAASRNDPVLQGTERSATRADVGEDQPQILQPGKPRPRLETRHSYAGHGTKPEPRATDESAAQDARGSKKGPVRPSGPRRFMTHAAGMSADQTFGASTPTSQTSRRHTSVSDPEFSTVVGSSDGGPYAAIFPALRSIDHECQPLIERPGIACVLQRGRVVIVNRQYTQGPSDQSARRTTVTASSYAAQEKTSTDHRSVSASENRRSLLLEYEEYEQHPTSPWAQSPAPSPAIQADEERNPFFASEEQQVEDSFNPAVSPKDYSQISQIEAIGVDPASTLIHIPLVHPTISQPMPSLNTTAQGPGQFSRTNTIDPQRKAPIAILSVMSSVIPYPSNLTHSFRLLGPHLATSFFIAQQFSALRGKTVQIRQRIPAPGETITSAPMTVELASLDDMVFSDMRTSLDQASETMTSPSEYSNRSKTSPSASIVGTPSWEAHGWTPTRSVSGTPANTSSERSEDYFDSKKRHKATSQASVPPSGSIKPSKKSSRSGGKAPMTSSHDDTTASHGRRRAVPAQSGNADEATLVPPLGEQDSTDTPRSRPQLSHLPELHKPKHHSLLHSYGADYQSTFGVLPAPSFVGPGHVRRQSNPEFMPAPSERLLRLIIDSVPVQIFTAQPDTGNLNWVNGKVLNYRGQDARDVLLDPWQAVHPEEREAFLSSWNRSLRTNQQMSQKVRLRNKEGDYRWFYVRCLPLKNSQQKVVHWIGTMMDFHEQHMAELNFAHQKEMEASQAKYKALANSSPQIVFSAQKARGITFCNTQWLQYSGQTEKQALGQGFLDHVHPDDLSKCRFPVFEAGSNQPTNVPTSLPLGPKRTTSAVSSVASSETEKATGQSDTTVTPTSQTPQVMPQRKLAELASTGILKVTRDADGRPSYSTEVRLKSKDNEFRWHLVRVLLADTFIEGEKEETWYGTCTDINDHKTLERDLKETMDEKSRFLSNMSHEIRTPLNGITGMVNFLMDSNLTEEQMEHVNIIRTSTEGLRGLINDILDLSKAEAGMINLSMDWLYPRALIEEVNDLTSTMAIDKGLELNYIIDEHVPAVIKGDKFRVRQILLNVVGNAIKFTQTGEVFVRCSRQDDEHEELGRNEMFLKFDVIDTGRGFTDQEAEFLFKRFSQIDGSSTRQHGGTGLGLVISRQLAQLHGGDMTAIGVPNQGSTFTFFIKVDIVSDPPTQLPSGSGSEDTVSSVNTDTASKRPSIAASANASSESSESTRAWSRIVQATTESPLPYLTPSPGAGRVVSPAHSSASSDPSLRSTTRSGSGSARSARSSASSYLPDVADSPSAMALSLPSGIRRTSSSKPQQVSSANAQPEMADTNRSPQAGITSPPMFSILVVAPLKYSREATVYHIEKTLPKNVPHQITARESYAECRDLLEGLEPIKFSHVVAVLHDVDEIAALMAQSLGPGSSTALILITDLAQRKRIVEHAPRYPFAKLTAERRLIFIFKPLKPSRLGLIFDPQKEREMSTDRNQDNAQQVASDQKLVFEKLKTRLGNKGKRVLLVEDNRVNQMVILKYFAKSAIQVDTVLDGVQCTDKVFASAPGHYSIILCDLHMPNKDGYQTCKELREWEKTHKGPPLPIIALSANVLGDVYQKCADAGFNAYMTKPVDFKELSTVLLKFMDPADPTKPHELMKTRRG